MKDKPRKQLSLRFDNYVELLEEAEKYCKTNNITLTHLVATGLRLAMTSQQTSQLPSHDKADNNDDRLANTVNTPENIKELIAEKIEQAANLRTIDRELIRDEIDHRTAYLATAMNEVKSQLENEIEFLKTRVKILEQNQEERLEHPPALPEVTTQEITLPMLQDEEDAIATEPNEENLDPTIPLVISPRKWVNYEPYLTNAKNLVRARLNTPRKINRLEITDKEIKSKILELYPDPQKMCCEEGISLVVKTIIEESKKAIAPKATEKKIALAVAGEKISKEKLKSIATSIQNTLKNEGIELNQIIIKAKVLEMYPNPNDWYPRSEARNDVKEALKREHK